MKNKCFQILTFCMIAVFFFNVVSLTARADSFDETEPNDTMETAETVLANNEKPDGVPDGKREGQSVIHGDTSSKDADWYKVFLSAGTNYMTCYGQLADTFTFRITNSEGGTILSDVYSKTGRGLAVYRFSAPVSGYYYVELLGTKSDSAWYAFMIGSPTYQLDSCTISCEEGTVSMTSGGARTVHFDGGSISGLPRDAIASEVKMTGVNSNAVSSIWVDNVKGDLGFSLVKYTWYRNKLISMKLPVDSLWEAEFGYQKVISFTPVLRVNYVYPVYENVVME